MWRATILGALLLAACASGGGGWENVNPSLNIDGAENKTVAYCSQRQQETDSGDLSSLFIKGSNVFAACMRTYGFAVVKR